MAQQLIGGGIPRLWLLPNGAINSVIYSSNFVRNGTLYVTIKGGDLASTWVAKPEVHAERVVTLVKQSL